MKYMELLLRPKKSNLVEERNRLDGGEQGGISVLEKLSLKCLLERQLEMSGRQLTV